MIRPSPRPSAALCAAVCATLLLSACASTPVARRAAQIADADQQAKAALAAENAIDAGKIPARTFAVLPFAVAAKDTLLTPLSFGIADLLVDDLSKTPELKLVERMRTSAIMRELDLVDQGLVDPKQGPRVGRLVGARRLLIGDASRATNGDLVLTARVVDVIGGTVQELITAQAPFDRFFEAEKEVAIRLLERLGITLTPAQRQRIEQRQTTQLAAVVAFGRGVQAEAKGDAVGATAAFADAARLDAAYAASRSSGTTVQAPASAQRVSSLARVLDISTQAINTPVVTRVPEAADAPLAVGSVLSFVFIIRVTP